MSEGLPGYFGERGKVGTRQPNLGLDELFGARETYVEFTPDLLEGLKLKVLDKGIGGRFFLQQYEPTAGGKAAGRYDNGATSAIEHGFGKGRALLIGTFPGAAYFLHHSPDTKAFFAALLDWAGVKQQVKVSVPDVKARLHTGAGGNYLWVVNPTRQPRTRGRESGQEHGGLLRCSRCLAVGRKGETRTRFVGAHSGGPERGHSTSGSLRFVSGKAVEPATGIEPATL